MMTGAATSHSQVASSPSSPSSGVKQPGKMVLGVITISCASSWRTIFGCSSRLRTTWSESTLQGQGSQGCARNYPLSPLHAIFFAIHVDGLEPSLIVHDHSRTGMLFVSYSSSLFLAFSPLLVYGRTFTVTNGCPFTIWYAAYLRIVSDCNLTFFAGLQ